MDIDPRIIEELKNDAETNESKITNLETDLRTLIADGQRIQKSVSSMETVTYVGFIVLLVMVAGMLFDFFSMRRAENSNVQPVINNYYYSSELQNQK